MFSFNLILLNLFLLLLVLGRHSYFKLNRGVLSMKHGTSGLSLIPKTTLVMSFFTVLSGIGRRWTSRKISKFRVSKPMTLSLEKSVTVPFGHVRPCVNTVQPVLLHKYALAYCHSVLSPKIECTNDSYESKFFCIWLYIK